VESKDIKDVSYEALGVLLTQWGAPRFLAKQIFAWLYQKGVRDFKQMSDVSLEWRAKLAETFVSSNASVKQEQSSFDGTRKILLTLRDKACVEAVMIPVLSRATGCLSTQVGCKFKCAFCASGVGGFKRNLSAGEILEEALCIQERAPGKKLTNVVFMGTGEPFDNYDALLQSIRIINASQGMGIGARHITISTCGIVPGIQRLAQEGLQVELCVSLHATDERTRSAILPVNRAYPLRELMAACRAYVRKTGRQVTFEYVLIKDFNCSLKNAQDLVTLCKGFDSKINLIPFNPVTHSAFLPPGKIEALYFQDVLRKAGIPVTFRRPRGRDIDAACGQLLSLR